MGGVTNEPSMEDILSSIKKIIAEDSAKPQGFTRSRARPADKWEVRFTGELSKIVRTALGVAPFVAKRNTPLDGTPFAGIAEVEGRLERLRKGLGKVAPKRTEVRPTSARWAWIEYVLAQGDGDAGLRAYAAHQAGGGFAAWKRAFAGYQTRHERAQARQALRKPAGSPDRVSLPVL